MSNLSIPNINDNFNRAYEIIRKGNPHDNPFNKTKGEKLKLHLIEEMDDYLHLWHYYREQIADRTDLQNFKRLSYTYNTKIGAIELYVLYPSRHSFISIKRRIEPVRPSNMASVANVLPELFKVYGETRDIYRRKEFYESNKMVTAFYDPAFLMAGGVNTYLNQAERDGYVSELLSTDIPKNDEGEWLAYSTANMLEFFYPNNVAQAVSKIKGNAKDILNYINTKDVNINLMRVSRKMEAAVRNTDLQAFSDSFNELLNINPQAVDFDSKINATSDSLKYGLHNSLSSLLQRLTISILAGLVVFEDKDKADVLLRQFIKKFSDFQYPNHILSVVSKGLNSKSSPWRSFYTNVKDGKTMSDDQLRNTLDIGDYLVALQKMDWKTVRKTYPSVVLKTLYALHESTDSNITIAKFEIICDFIKSCVRGLHFMHNDVCNLWSLAPLQVIYKNMEQIAYDKGEPYATALASAVGSAFNISHVGFDMSLFNIFSSNFDCYINFRQPYPIIDTQTLMQAVSAVKLEGDLGAALNLRLNAPYYALPVLFYLVDNENPIVQSVIRQTVVDIIKAVPTQDRNLKNEMLAAVDKYFTTSSHTDEDVRNFTSQMVSSSLDLIGPYGRRALLGSADLSYKDAIDIALGDKPNSLPELGSLAMTLFIDMWSHKLIEQGKAGELATELLTTRATRFNRDYCEYRQHFIQKINSKTINLQVTHSGKGISDKFYECPNEIRQHIIDVLRDALGKADGLTFDYLQDIGKAMVITSGLLQPEMKERWLATQQVFSSMM